jgi:hypothetical protein
MSGQYFIGACILAGGLQRKAGAPPSAIVMGIALAACFHWMRRRRAASK